MKASTASRALSRSAVPNSRYLLRSRRWYQQRERHHADVLLNRSRAFFPNVPASQLNRRAVGTQQEGAITLPTPLEDAVDPQFDYSKAWYPVAILADLDPKRPHALQLLGKDLVVWRDAQKKWRCFEDLCPHRKVALSEGRIEPSDGSLQCSYHGWRFNGEGKCTLVPQITDPKAQSTACASPRSCATAFPTQEAQGLVWVWGSSGEAAQAEAEATPAPLIAELEGPTPWSNLSQWYMRDLPYSYDVLLENLVDPTHLPFSHHGVAGNRNKPSQWVITSERPVDLKKGFTCTATKEGQLVATMEFQPPSLFRYKFAFGSFDSFSIPTRPGWSRIIGVNLLKPGAALPFQLASKLPNWVSHAFNSGELLDGDGIFLRYQEKWLRRNSGNWKGNWYLPAAADTAVVALRTWLDKFGGGSGPCSSRSVEDLPDLPRSVMLDRYEQHVKHCKTCQGALRVINRLKAAAVAAGILFVAAAAASAKAATGLRALVQWESGKWLVAVAAVALVYKWLDGLVGRFYFRDYVHAER